MLLLIYIFACWLSNQLFFYNHEFHMRSFLEILIKLFCSTLKELNVVNVLFNCAPFLTVISNFRLLWYLTFSWSYDTFYSFTFSQMLRCSLRKNPSSSLVSDCINAMAEGLQSCFYSHFVSLFWGDSDATYLYSNSHVDSEWEYFSYEIKRICTEYGQTLPTKSPILPSKAWDFLVNSKYHAQYCKRAPTSYNSFLPVSYDTHKTIFNPQDEHSTDVSYYIRFMRETLETLHALYENLKLNILRKE